MFGHTKVWWEQSDVTATLNRAAIHQMLYFAEKTVALLAFKDAPDNPVSHLATKEQRYLLAQRVNQAILKHDNEVSCHVSSYESNLQKKINLETRGQSMLPQFFAVLNTAQKAL